MRITTSLKHLARPTAGALVALVAAAGIAGAPPARAGEPAKLDVVEEMAGAMGFASSKSEGFWEALAQARIEDRERAEAQRDEQVSQMILDAAEFGRRVEEVTGRYTSFTEFIPPRDGDIVAGEVLVRTGDEWVADSGKTMVFTTYWRGFTRLGLIASEIEDGVETVTAVREFEPGSIDVKVGDEREVPPPGSSAAGKKPHTIDPKSDGSVGRASGGRPDGGESHRIKDSSWTAPAEATAAGGTGTRLEFEPIPLPDGKKITPLLEDKPPGEDLPYRSGFDMEHPDWDGGVARITASFDKDGKLAGVVGSVIHKGIETVVTVTELTPGSLGLNEGDQRPSRDAILMGNTPSTWDPKPQTRPGAGATGGSGQATGGASEKEPETNGTTDAGSAATDGERAKPETAPDGGATKEPAPAADGTTSGAGSSSSGEAESKYEFHGVGPERQNDDGSKSQNTVHERKEDGVLVQTITTTHKDGTTTQTKNCFKDSQEVDCGEGMTDEPPVAWTARG